MKINQILRTAPKMQNLVVVNSDVSAQDVLVVLRHAAQKLCHVSYPYISSRSSGETILANDLANLTFEEFAYLVSKRRDSVEYMLERGYGLADFQLMEWLKPKKTTPKRDIIAHILNHPELLFEHFKEETTKVIVESVEALRSYDRIERDGYQLYFPAQTESNVLPGTALLEQWRLIHSYAHDLRINLLEDDAAILSRIEAFVQGQPASGEFRLEVHGTALLAREHDEEGIHYQTDIASLEKEFGIRKQSKKATFAENLRHRQNAGTVRRFLGSKIFITYHAPRMGELLTKETFEALALHLRVLYVEERQGILCEVTDKESEEIVHALWQEHGIHFYPVLVEKGGEPM
jgi:hypothetical protein